jgi:DNA-binding beta-propeller fold protein YncE
MDGRDATRREFLKALGTAAAAAALPSAARGAETPGVPSPGVPAAAASDRVFVAAEDSSTLVVLDPARNAVEATINLTSFDEDPRAPFRLAVGGAVPSAAAMVQRPLYHGCIGLHGVAPSADGWMLAACGRGSGNLYLVDTGRRAVLGNALNPQAGPTTNPERLSPGIALGRDPAVPAFTRSGREIWVALRGEDRIAVVDVERALRQVGGTEAGAVVAFVPTVSGPARTWFGPDGTLAFVASQKASRIDVLRVDPAGIGRATPRRLTILDVSAQDPVGFTTCVKGSPDGREAWFVHELADAVSARQSGEPFGLVASIALGEGARPAQVELVENAKGKVAYVTQGRVDDGGPGGVASSRVAIVDLSAPPGQRKVAGTFFSHGREAQGLWADPSGTRLYVAHAQDELPGTPDAGQPVVSAFDVSEPLTPRLVARVPLGALSLPSGELRNRRGGALVYVRPGHRAGG